MCAHKTPVARYKTSTQINNKKTPKYHVSHLTYLLPQVVGCTIDAGAKIYAGRVDAVHSDILKMLGTMGNAEGDDQGDDKQGIISSIIFIVISTKSS